MGSSDWTQWVKEKKKHEIGRGAWAALGEVGWEVDEIIIYLYMYDVLTEQINKIKKILKSKSFPINKVKDKCYKYIQNRRIKRMPLIK